MPRIELVSTSGFAGSTDIPGVVYPNTKNSSPDTGQRGRWWSQVKRSSQLRRVPGEAGLGGDCRQVGRQRFGVAQDESIWEDAGSTIAFDRRAQRLETEADHGAWSEVGDVVVGSDLGLSERLEGRGVEALNETLAT